MTPTEPSAEALASAFANVSAILSSSANEKELFARIASLAVATIESCDLAGVIADEHGKTSTIAASGPRVYDIDRMQIDEREGPCLDVLAGESSRYGSDFLLEGHQWPRFSRAAVDAGIRSAFAIGIGAPGTPAVLNLYAELPHAFGPRERAQGAIFATHARVALAAQQQRNHDDAALGQLHEALVTRELIGQAQGILMERERITGDQAFDMLRRASQHLNVKLRDVAQQLIDTGETPENGTTS